MLDIYRNIYNFNEQPFRLTPDYRFCYSHPSYEAAKSYMKYAISQGEGFVAITGEPGTGKTTLIVALLAELDQERVKVAMLTNVQLDSEHFLQMMLDEFGLQADSQNPLQLLKSFLVEQHKNGIRCVLIVDEAQGLSKGSLEGIRLLSNIQYDNCLLLQVFLVGQGSLMNLIRKPKMEQLHQRLIAASEINLLGLTETKGYIEHRLNKAGWHNDPVFAKGVMRLIYKFSVGVPRRINLICHRLFLYAGLNEKHELTVGDAFHVIAELDDEGLLDRRVSNVLEIRNQSL